MTYCMWFIDKMMGSGPPLNLATCEQFAWLVLHNGAEWVGAHLDQWEK